MADDKKPSKLDKLVARMAELNAEASLLSAEIDAHLNRRRDAHWPEDSGPVEDVAETA